MRCPHPIADEEGRLAALQQYGFVEGIELPSLQPIVQIAARMFDVPAAAVNMIGSDHVFFAASAGIDTCDMGRDVSFCAHAITQDEVLVVEDAELDPRFHDNPLVTSGMIRFYAGVPLVSPSGHPLGALCVVDDKPHASFSSEDRARLRDLARLAGDKLELRRLEAAKEAQPSRFEAIAATSPYAVICFDRTQTITATNVAAQAMFGYSAGEMLGRELYRLMPDEEHFRVRGAIARAIGGSAPPSNDENAFTGLRRDGGRFEAELTWSQWQENGEPHFGAVVRDVTDRRRHEDELYRLATRDGLTGLPNRALLYERAAAAIASGGTTPAIVMIDLDGFKDVNDTLGHAVGDAILQETARRLADCTASSDTAARIGGDEFAILVADCSDPLRLSALPDILIAEIARPIQVDGHEVRVAASCGLAIAPVHGETVDELIGSADLALFQAKTGGRGRSFLFVPALRAEAVARRMYDAELHRAVERGELELHYQPQFALADGRLTGAEALLRWSHPQRGLLQPAAFLPVLDGGPLAATVGAWVIHIACAQAAEWRAMHPDFRIAVNLFAAQFRTDDLLETVHAALQAHGLPGNALELEITENIVLGQEELVLPQLEAVRTLGVALAFDDFGTGYASLNLLKSYPISHIKIDKSFTQAIASSPSDRAIVASLIDLAHQLGLEVIAEGIETQDQWEELAGRRCEEGQGYLSGKPVPAALFEELFVHERPQPLFMAGG